MAEIIREGYTIRIKLPKECGYEGYSVKCTYKYNKAKQKYRLLLWLKRDNIEDDFKIDAQEIDMQFIKGTQETIQEHIGTLIEQASLSGYLHPYIERFEYTRKCFELGNESFEKDNIKNSGGIV